MSIYTINISNSVQNCCCTTTHLLQPKRFRRGGLTATSNKQFASFEHLAVGEGVLCVEVVVLGRGVVVEVVHGLAYNARHPRCDGRGVRVRSAA